MQVGFPAELRVGGSTTTAVIESIGGPDPETAESPVVVTAEEIPIEWLGEDALVVVTIDLLAQDALIVPSRALTPSGDDAPTILRQLADGTFEAVSVREIARLSGRSAVEPIEPGTLKEGDLVQVG